MSDEMLKTIKSVCYDKRSEGEDLCIILQFTILLLAIFR